MIRLIAGLALLALLSLGAAQGALARVYSEAELSAFKIADVTLDMDVATATKNLTARQYTQDSSDPSPNVATWKGPQNTIVTLQISTPKKKIAAIGLFTPLPASTTLEYITKTVVPSLIGRFGEATEVKTAGEMVVMTYLTPAPGAGATAFTLRISKAGIDGRLGR
jgi:hypothetical protein